MSNGDMELHDPGEGRASGTKEKDEFRPLMDKLAEIGGGYFRPEDDIVQEGNRIVIPVGMSMSRAAKFLMKRVAADEDTTNFVRRYKYRPYDGAVCTWRALKRAFGMVGLTQRTEQTFFGPVKANAQFVDVPVGTNIIESVPWGAFQLPTFHDTAFQPDMYMDEEMGPLFVLNVMGPRKYKPQIEGIFALVQEELENDSIYRGKAFEMMSAVFKPLKRLRTQTGAAIILIHHHVKNAGDQAGARAMYGSVALWAWEEAALHLQVVGPGRIVAERFSKHSQLQPLTIDVGDTSLGWTPTVTIGLTETRDLIDLIGQYADGMTTEELASQANMGRDRAIRELKSLEEQGKIESHPGPKQPGHRGRRPRVWLLKGG